jgi:hypothetical protein
VAGDWRRGGIRWSIEPGEFRSDVALVSSSGTRFGRADLFSAGAKNLQIIMTQQIAGDDRDEPATLHRTIQLMLGERLRAYYRPPKKLSHELFVLMMQMKEQERRHANSVAAALKAGLKPKAVES